MKRLWIPLTITIVLPALAMAQEGPDPNRPGAREEIDFQSRSSLGGDNYAWNRREGLIAHLGGALLPDDDQPVYDYEHDPKCQRQAVGLPWGQRGFAPR